MAARLFGILKRGAEAVGALLFLLMFLAFLLQVGSRYLLDSPLGWTLEASLAAYLWFVFWASALMLREQDQVRFDLLLRALPARGRRWLEMLAAAATLALFGVALWPTADWIGFMRIDRTWTLGIRFDLLFSVYLLFMAAVLLRSAGALVSHLIRRPGNDER